MSGTDQLGRIGLAMDANISTLDHENASVSGCTKSPFGNAHGSRIALRHICSSDALRRVAGENGHFIYLWLFLIAAALSIVASARTVAPVFHGELLDPDSFMRLVRLEQGLRLGHLVNVVQRDNSGLPLVIEWSRLFDAAIVALAAPLAPLIGWHRALAAAGVATGPICIGLFSASLSFAVARLANGRFLWAAAIIAPLLPGIREFATFGVIHYHIAQVASVALMVGCALRAVGGDKTWAICTGISGGFAIWIMPETMPWVLLVEAGLGWVWLFRSIGRAVLLNGLSFFLTVATALWLDPPHGGVLTVEIDRLSIVYLALALAVVATSALLALLDRLHVAPRKRTVFGIGAAVVAFGVWLSCFPSVALGPYGLMSAEEMRLFFGNMAETQPVHTISEGIALLGPGLLALIYAAWKVRRERASLSAVGGWMLVTIGILLATGLTARFVIFAQYPPSFLAALLPIALNEASDQFAAWPRRAAAARIGLIASVVWLPMSGHFADIWIRHERNEPNRPSCTLRHSAALLAPAAGRIVLSLPDEVPELLYRTEVVGVGSLYQHGIEGYLRAWMAWRTPSEGSSEPAATAATGAEFVLFCPRYDRFPFGTAPAQSLWSMLAEGHVPPWLTLVSEQNDSGFKLYRIAR